MLFSNNIEKIIFDIVKLLDQSSLCIIDQDFQKGFRYYYDQQKTFSECYEYVFPNNAIVRMLKKIDDEKEVQLMQKIFVLIKKLIAELAIDFPQTLKDKYEYVLQLGNVHFYNHETEKIFHYAIACILQYKKYNFVTTISQKLTRFPSELKPFWNEKDFLFDVSNFDQLGENFYYAAKDIVLYPEFCHNYELKEKISQYYKKIAETAKLSVSALRFSPKSEYTGYQYVQEEKLFGMPFNKSNFKKLFQKEYGVYKYSENEDVVKQLSQIPLYELQYVIKPLNNNEISFMLEEVIDVTCDSYTHMEMMQYGTDKNFFIKNRLIHFIFDNQQDSIVHFDLSYLYYDNEAYFKRITQRLCDKTENATVKHKIFRIDGPLEFDIACLLIGGALNANHNPEVVRLLSGA